MLCGGSLTGGTLERTAGGRADLAPVVLNALGQLHEGGVPGEAAFSSGRWKQVFGTVVYRRAGLQHTLLLRGAFGCGALRV